MANLLFANNASSLIAAPVGTGDTTVTVSNGAIYPAPGANEYFVATFVDAASGLINEIVHCTDVTGNVLTIVRAQEGTTAKTWNVGDVCAAFWTAGCAQAMLQQSQSQSQSANYAVDTGPVNAMAVTLSPAPTALSAIVGTPVRVKVNFKNTSTTPTLNVNGLGDVAVYLPDGVAMGVGYLVNGTIWEFLWNGSFFQVSGQISPASSAQVNTGTDNTHPITSAALRAAMPNTISGGAISANYQKFPTGLIVVWGNFTVTGGGTDTVTLATALPNHMQASAANAATSGGQAYTCSISPGSSPPVSTILVDSFVFNAISHNFDRAGGANVSYVCFGY